MTSATKTSSLFDTKTHLSGLITEVEKGGTTIVITRHGKPVAKLVPYTDDGLAERRAKALATLRKAAQEAGIRYTTEQLLEPIDPSYWGVMGEDMDDQETHS